MDELVERVARALAAEYAGAPNGRVRDLPDRRAIRWYTTTGLVDRPLGMRGRTALYGPRHLLQLVAVKRRQAQGHPLAAIQSELHDASDAVLADVARVPQELLTGGEPAAGDATAPTRFWTTAPAASSAVPATAADETDESTETAPLGAVRLRGGAVLVLPGVPGAADRAAIEAAAEPLLTLLADRGLLKFDDGNQS
jgi:DNA-binding transcriptional MerR regulator